MRTLSIAGPLLASFVAFAAYGCTLDLGGLQATTSSGGGGEMSTSTLTSMSSVGGAGPSSASASSGPAGGAGGMTTSVTSSSTTGSSSSTGGGCTDPGSGTKCVTNAPSGWTFIDLVTGGATCPAGSTQLAPVEGAPMSPPQCSCACDCTGPENNPCVHGTLTVNIGMGCSAFNKDLAVSGGCDPLGGKFPMKYNTIKATPLPVTAVPVAGDTSLPGTQPGTVGLTCTPDVDSAPGCAGDETCLPKTTSAALCIMSDGDVACPGGTYTKRVLVGAPGAVDDQRTCGACTCSSGAASCANPTFAAFPDGNCDTAVIAAPLVAGQCKSPSSGDWNGDDHFIYSATPTAPTCAVSVASDVLGEVKPASPKTICCPP